MVCNYFDCNEGIIEKPYHADSISSGGRASEIHSSGMMTPKSFKSLSTPN